MPPRMIADHMRRLLSSFSLLLLLAACGSDHPLAGSWNEQLPDDKKGLSVEFSTKSDECLVHTAPEGPDGHHEHVHGTYEFDAATGALTVRAALRGKSEQAWTGKLANGAVELRAGEDRVALKRGGSAHAH